MHLVPRNGTTQRQIAYTAAAMYGGAAVVVIGQALTPGGPPAEPVTALVALAAAPLLVVAGPRVPLGVLAMAGPLGVVTIGVAIASTPGAGDGAALYIWPVLWVAYFFGRRETVAIVLWIGVVHAAALIALPSGDGYADRWIDVMVSVSVVGLVVQALSHQNEALLRRFSDQARVDALTGLLNRRGFDERASTDLARAAREDVSVAVVSLDIDHFKRINDDYGHDAGDRVLVRLGEIFRNQSRGSDLVVRMGGEEFAALLWAADAEDGLAFAERVRETLAAVDDLGVGRVTISGGVAAARQPQSVEELLRQADGALYEAKCAGRNRTIVHGGLAALTA
jgi:diguanylate cyclase (GGDEF)-like protein